jgi:hypothetical protein
MKGLFGVTALIFSQPVLIFSQKRQPKNETAVTRAIRFRYNRHNSKNFAQKYIGWGGFLIENIE